MRWKLLAVAISAGFTAQVQAQSTALDPALADLGFLVGTWTSADGTVADTGGTAKGTSSITVEANGHVLLRRDHTELFDRAGKATGAFDQIMMIYPDRGALHADYSDGSHVIHYESATVVPGHSVSFLSPGKPDVPAFRLSYELMPGPGLSVTFGMAPPGQSEFHPIASGTLKKRG